MRTAEECELLQKMIRAAQPATLLREVTDDNFSDNVFDQLKTSCKEVYLSLAKAGR